MTTIRSWRRDDLPRAGVMRDNENAIRFYKAHGISEEYLLLGKEFEGT
ncbi:MAG: hypothetical protein JXA15_04035 [Spirochaetales bacterium]|nr:hypothetical protein [Spirochaetales bacterium]